MALSAAKYRRLPELFVTGTEVELGDGLVMWMQAINPFEQDEARHDASVARARLTLALKSEAGSTERQKVEAAFYSDGREASVRLLLDLTAGKRMLRALDEVESDPEWTERLDVIKRSDELVERPDDDPEKAYLRQVNIEYTTELQRRSEEMAEVEKVRLDALSTPELLEEFVDTYLDRRGTEVAMREHRMTELWYAARVCDGDKLDDGRWDHSRCDGHRVRVWEDKDEVRQLPKSLQDLLAETMSKLNMTARDARFSDRQGSSSTSSPLPSTEGESTPSTPGVTSSAVPGISPQRFPTR